MSLYYEKSCSSCGTNFNNLNLNISKDCGVSAIRNILVKIINFIQGYKGQEFSVDLEITTKNGISKIVTISKNSTDVTLNELNLIVGESIFSLCDIVKITIITNSITNSEFYQLMITYLKKVGKYNNNSCTGFIRCEENSNSDLKCAKEMQNYIGQNINRIKSVNYNGGMIKAQIIPKRQDDILVSVIDTAILNFTNEEILSNSNLNINKTPVVSSINLTENKTQVLSSANLTTTDKPVIKTFEPTNTTVVSNINLNTQPLVSNLNVNKIDVSAPITVNQETVLSGILFGVQQPISNILDTTENAISTLTSTTENILSNVTTTTESVITDLNETEITGYTNLNETNTNAKTDITTTTTNIVGSVTTTPKTAIKQLNLVPQMVVNDVTKGTVNGAISGVTSIKSTQTTSVRVPVFSIPAGTNNQPLQVTIPANAITTGIPPTPVTINLKFGNTNATFSYNQAYFLPNQTNVLELQGTPAVSNIDNITNVTETQVIKTLNPTTEEVVGTLTATNVANPVIKSVALNGTEQVIKSVTPDEVSLVGNITPIKNNVIKTVTADTPVSAIKTINTTTKPVISDITLVPSDERTFERTTTETINNVSNPNTVSVVKGITSNLDEFKGVENITTVNVDTLFRQDTKNAISNMELNSSTENIISSATLNTTEKEAISDAFLNITEKEVISNISLNTTKQNAIKSLSSENIEVTIPTEETLTGDVVAIGDGIMVVDNLLDGLTLYSVCDVQSATV